LLSAGFQGGREGGREGGRKRRGRVGLEEGLVFLHLLLLLLQLLLFLFLFLVFKLLSSSFSSVVALSFVEPVAGHGAFGREGGRERRREGGR